MNPKLFFHLEYHDGSRNLLCGPLKVTYDKINMRDDKVPVYIDLLEHLSPKPYYILKDNIYLNHKDTVAEMILDFEIKVIIFSPIMMQADQKILKKFQQIE